MLTKALHFPGIKQLAFSPVTSQLLSSWPQPLPYQTNNWKNLCNLGPIHCSPFSVPPPFTFFRCSQSMLVPCAASLPPISQQQCLQFQHKLRHVGTFIMKNNSKSPPFPMWVPHPADTWLQCQKYCSSRIQITSSVVLLRLLTDCSSLSPTWPSSLLPYWPHSAPAMLQIPHSKARASLQHCRIKCL